MRSIYNNKSRLVISIATGFLVLFSLLFEAYGKSDDSTDINVVEISKSDDEVLQELDFFNKTLFFVQKQYYRDVSVKQLIEGAIKGMLATLDPHSSFLSEDLFKRMKSDTNGEFKGIGIEVSMEKEGLIIVTAIDETPAYEAGVKAGDKLKKVNGVSTQGLSLDEAIQLMKGDVGESIVLGIQRGKETLDFKITRKLIKLKPVKTKEYDEYAVFRISQFQRNTGKYLEKELSKVKKGLKKDGKSLKGIVLDLRSNPGGLLDEAVKVSSIFLETGVVVTTRMRSKENSETHYVKKSGLKELKAPLIVLVNESSASASEIVAGALQDHKRAIILGTRTFGKGSVQTVSQLDKNRGIKLTIAQYQTPNQRLIQAVGISPDIFVAKDGKTSASESASQRKIMREENLERHIKRSGKFPASLPGAGKIEDYQVFQAINYLQGHHLFQEIGTTQQ